MGTHPRGVRVESHFAPEELWRCQCFLAGGYLAARPATVSVTIVHDLWFDFDGQ